MTREQLEVEIPDYTLGALDRWINHGLPPGYFLESVLSNNLVESCGYADENNRPAIFAIVSWLYNYAPGECWGSPEKVAKWPSRFATGESCEDLELETSS